jgi:hypothetical protein
MLIRAVKMAFWATWDHLGKLLMMNVLCMLVLVLPGGAGLSAVASGDPWLALIAGAPLLLLALLLMPVLAVGMAQMAREIIDTRDTTPGAFFKGIRLYGWRAFRLGLAWLIVLVCLLTSVWFYAGRLGASAPLVGYTLSALAGWALLFALLGMQFLAPVLVQKRAGVAESMKTSLLLVLDNPLFCLGLALNGIVLASFSIMPPVLLLFSIAPVVMLETSGYEMLARKYAALAALDRGDPDPGARRIGRRVRLEFKDGEDDFLNRGFQDFLFPWKG